MTQTIFDFFKQIKEETETKERVKKISKSIKKTDKPLSDMDALAVGHLLLGISHFEDVDIDSISHPEVLKKIEIITKLKAFVSMLASDAASMEALTYLRTVLTDSSVTVKDKISAASAILNNKKKQQKEIYEFLDVFKDLFISQDGHKSASEMSNEELAKSITSVLSFLKK